MKVDQPWAHLTTDQPIVLLAKNVGQPIVPVSERLCSLWKSVPPHENYLAMMGKAVKSFLVRQENGLSDLVDWQNSLPIIQSHRIAANKPIIHSQRLFSTKTPSSNKRIRRSLEAFPKSSFAFGDHQGKNCYPAFKKSFFSHS